MEVIIEHTGKFAIVRMIGRLNALSSEEFHQMISDQIGEGVYQYLFDCSELEYISSAGIRILFLLLKKLQEHEGKIVIGSPNNNLLNIFEMIGLSAHMAIAPSVEEGIRKFR